MTRKRPPQMHGAIYGVAGLAVEAAPLPWWTIGAGAGTSLFGPQLALSTRVRYAWGHGAIALGVGGSRGPFDAGSSAGESNTSWTKHWAGAYWFNVEGSVEHRWADGFQFRFYFGVATLLNPNTTQPLS